MTDSASNGSPDSSTKFVGNENEWPRLFAELADRLSPAWNVTIIPGRATRGMRAYLYAAKPDGTMLVSRSARRRHKTTGLPYWPARRRYFYVRLPDERWFKLPSQDGFLEYARNPVLAPPGSPLTQSPLNLPSPAKRPRLEPARPPCLCGKKEHPSAEAAELAIFNLMLRKGLNGDRGVLGNVYACPSRPGAWHITRQERPGRP